MRDTHIELPWEFEVYFDEFRFVLLSIRIILKTLLLLLWQAYFLKLSIRTVNGISNE